MAEDPADEFDLRRAIHDMPPQLVGALAGAGSRPDMARKANRTSASIRLALSLSLGIDSMARGLMRPSRKAPTRQAAPTDTSCGGNSPASIPSRMIRSNVPQ